MCCNTSCCHPAVDPELGKMSQQQKSLIMTPLHVSITLGEGYFSRIKREGERCDRLPMNQKTSVGMN